MKKKCEYYEKRSFLWWNAHVSFAFLFWFVRFAWWLHSGAAFILVKVSWKQILHLCRPHPARTRTVRRVPQKKKKNISGTDSVESMNHLSEEKYYVKVSGEYLSVYFSDTDRLYFETILKVSNLPEYLRRDALEGIPFTSLENLYSFLENYSS